MQDNGLDIFVLLLQLLVVTRIPLQNDHLFVVGLKLKWQFGNNDKGGDEKKLSQRMCRGSERPR